MAERFWSNVEFVFCDVGNILLDEDPLAYFVFARHAEAVARVHPGVSFFDLLAAREVRAMAGARWALAEAVAEFLPQDESERVWREADRDVRARHCELAPIANGAYALLDRLGAHYRLGVIANQIVECRARLQGLGLLDRFEVVALSEELGLYKPDQALYAHALEEAGVPAEKAVMIGDRLDKDVEPASSLGMNTIYVRWPVRSAKGWQPREQSEIEFLASLERIARDEERRLCAIRPSLVVDTTGEIQPASG